MAADTTGFLEEQSFPSKAKQEFRALTDWILDETVGWLVHFRDENRDGHPGANSVPVK